MIKRIGPITSDFFDRDNFYNLMKNFNAKQLSDLIWYSDQHETTVLYNNIGNGDLFLDTEVILYGNPKGIGRMEKEIRNTIIKNKKKKYSDNLC